MAKMTYKAYLKDLYENIDIMFNAKFNIEGKPKDFSEYHFVKYVSATDIEFLGKCLIASPEIFNISENGLSAYCFNYALLKLESFKDYRNFITNKNITKNKLYKKLNECKNDNNKIQDFIDIFIEERKSEPDFYTVRCGFTHKNLPNTNCGVTSKTNKPIYIGEDGNLKIDAKRFHEDIINACKELIDYNDNKIQTFINYPIIETKPVVNTSFEDCGPVINIFPVTGITSSNDVITDISTEPIIIEL